MKQYKLPRSFEKGLAYIGLLIVLALLALSAAAGVKITSLEQQRNAEIELFAIGLEFQIALNNYVNTTPPGAKRLPENLEDLLKDPRTSLLRRHLRKIYIDPMTRQANWGVLISADGKGIIGIYSYSKKRPIKIANFPAEFTYFEKANSYQDWIFALPLTSR